MKLKIGRHEYEITSRDEFMDNGCCVQLLTQSKESVVYGNKPIPKLSKRAIKELSGFDKVQIAHEYGTGVEVYSLDVPL